MSFDPKTYLEALSGLPDGEIDLAPAAIALAGYQQPGLSLERYCNHLKKLVEEVAERHADLLKEGAEDTTETQLAALKHILSDKHAYKGDKDEYDNLENASLTRVIDRGKGLPIALSILYIHAAAGQGWDVAGLNLPGHFVCRLQKDGQRLIFDPFNACKILEAHDLRALIKKMEGEHAELSANYYEPATNREILIRLQNNIKFRQITADDYEAALKTVETMRMIDPHEFRLLLDAGVLYAKTGQPTAAVEMLEGYIAVAPNDRDRHDAALLLQDLKMSLQ